MIHCQISCICDLLFDILYSEQCVKSQFWLGAGATFIETFIERSKLIQLSKAIFHTTSQPEFCQEFMLRNKEILRILMSRTFRYQILYFCDKVSVLQTSVFSFNYASSQILVGFSRQQRQMETKLQISWRKACAFCRVQL